MDKNMENEMETGVIHDLHDLGFPKIREPFFGGLPYKVMLFRAN